MKTLFEVNGYALLLVVILYVGAVVYLFSYLRQAHRGFWLDLGAPTLSTSDGHDHVQGLAQILMFLFSKKHTTLNDPRLTQLVWFIRISLLLVCVGFVTFLLIGAHTPMKSA